MRARSRHSAAVAVLAAACSPPHGSYRPPHPLGLDEYFAVPDDNPLTAEKIDLGRRLFFDPLLSADRKIACASCHQPHHAFSDTVPRSRGVYGRVGSRNAPTLVNVAYARTLFWDGRLETLEDQVLRPIQDSLEMDLGLDELVARLGHDTAYRRPFRRAFADSITATNVARALASYVRSLRFGDAAIDRFRAGDTGALSPEARSGLRLFVGKANCSACHPGPTLTDEQFHNTGVSWGSADLGRFMVTQAEEDRGRFSTPTLREVACTAPYMHDGSVATLEQVVEFYDGGGAPNPYLDPEIQSLRMTTGERRALVAFLRSLSKGCFSSARKARLPRAAPATPRCE
jgi:cytochrome c peroxidase